MSALELWRVPAQHLTATRCAHAYVLTAHGAGVWLKKWPAPTHEIDSQLNKVHEHEYKGGGGASWAVDWSEPPLFCQVNDYS